MNILSKIISLILLSGIAFGCMNSTADESKKYKPTWESLAKHDATPEWFQDAKFGIYFHWGPYSVPAYGSAWYPCNMYIKGSKVNKFHEENFGNIYEFGYQDFIPMFTAEHFDPEDWAELFLQAGAKFAGPVAQHHDGFAMWNSQVNPWNAQEMGPKRDILGEMFKALEKRNLKTLATFHHARNGQRNASTPENWGRNGFNSHYPYHPDLPTATKDPKLKMLFGNFDTEEEFNQYWLQQVNEVVDQYQPDMIWFDSWLNFIPASYRKEMLAHFFNEGAKNGQEVVSCHKQNDLPMESSVLDFEQGGRRDIYPIPWMTDITLGEHKWMYVEGHPYKSSSLVLRNMIDVWSKNGIVLLNVSPKANGIINQEQRNILKDIGDWFKIYGEAVYGTRPYYVFGYGNAKPSQSSHDGQSAKVNYTANDVRFTISKDNKSVYLFVLGVPKTGKRMKVRPLGLHRNCTPTPIKRMIDLGTGKEVKWEMKTDNFYFTIPDADHNMMANVYKLELE